MTSCVYNSQHQIVITNTSITYSASPGLLAGGSFRGSSGTALGGLEHIFMPRSCVGDAGVRFAWNAGLWGKGEISMASPIGDEVGIGGVVTDATRVS